MRKDEKVTNDKILAKKAPRNAQTIAGAIRQNIEWLRSPIDINYPGKDYVIERLERLIDEMDEALLLEMLVQSASDMVIEERLSRSEREMLMGYDEQRDDRDESDRDGIHPSRA